MRARVRRSFLMLIALGGFFSFSGVVVAACSDDTTGTNNNGTPDGSTIHQDSTTGNSDAVTTNPGSDSASPVDSSTTADAKPSDSGPDCVDAGLPSDAGCYVLVPLFNTGVGANHAALDGGSVDPHYTLIQSAEATLPGPNAIVVSQIAEGYWLPKTNESSWIAPSENQSYPGASPCNAAGNYTYRTTFSLAGFDPTTMRVNGNWAADNSGVAIKLNGTTLNITGGGYNPYTPFAITSGFVAGMNTLEFEINDTGCPNGLRVELSGVAHAQP